MKSFDEIIQYQADAVHSVLISDLHLSIHQPALMQAFLAFLDKLLLLPNLSHLFILGDWFEAWLGDDMSDTPEIQQWLAPMIAKLVQLTQNQCQIFIMQGNRDFLLGQKFCDKFSGNLMTTPFIFSTKYHQYYLTHGDELCTDDKKYQWFRKIIQNSLIKKFLLAQSITKRQKIADNLRQNSKKNNAYKSTKIMDVNANSVQKTIKSVDILIHGHTHRPAIHQLAEKKRMVLGDWREQSNHSVQAVIGVLINNQQILTLFDYSDIS